MGMAGNGPQVEADRGRGVVQGMAEEVRNLEGIKKWVDRDVRNVEVRESGETGQGTRQQK